MKRKIAEELFAVLFATVDSVDVPLAPEDLATDFSGVSETDLFAFALANSLARLDRPSIEDGIEDGQIFRGTHASTFSFGVEQLVEQRPEHGFLLMIPTQNSFAAMGVTQQLSVSGVDAFVERVQRVAPTPDTATMARTEIAPGVFAAGAEPVSRRLFYKRDALWTVVSTDDRGVIRDRIPGALREVLVS